MMTTHDASPVVASKWSPDDDLVPVELEGPANGAAGGETIKALVFVCRFPGCGRQFQLKGNLKRHQNIHRGDKQFVCDVCGRSFLRKADMEVHQRVHTGEKPYECKFDGCDKRFARRSDLLSHERTHSGKKPFECDFPGCGRRFARRFDLHKHQRMHEDGEGCTKKCKTNLKRRLVVGTDSVQSSDEDDCDCGDSEDSVKVEKPQRPQRASGATAAQAAPISPTDMTDGPGKEFHFELTCTEDHVHSTPDCFSSEEWDALLGTMGTNASPPLGAITACCPDHLQSIAEAFATAHAHTRLTSDDHGHAHSHAHSHAHNHAHSHETPRGYAMGASFTSALASSLGLTPLTLPSSEHNSTDSSQTGSSVSSPCPIAATANLHNYSAHTSCGHLAIQHGNHRDFVVKNHLVCLDSVKSLTGDCGAGGANGDGGCVKSKPKCAPQDPHRPGCGHLPVRHRDHIDYVVEDNLFCQHAGSLVDEADQIELLDDDFWEFYGAIGSLKTD